MKNLIASVILNAAAFGAACLGGFLAWAAVWAAFAAIVASVNLVKKGE